MATFTEHELMVEPEEAPQDHGISGTMRQQGLEDSVEAQTSPQQQQFARFAARVAWAPEQVMSCALWLNWVLLCFDHSKQSHTHVNISGGIMLMPCNVSPCSGFPTT